MYAVTQWMTINVPFVTLMYIVLTGLVEIDSAWHNIWYNIKTFV